MARTASTVGYVEFNENPLGSHMKMIEQVGRDKRVLDIGCSSGYLAKRLVDRGCTVIGMDLDPKDLEVAQQWCAEVYAGNIEDMGLPFEEGTFDVVLCGDLVEHLRDPTAALARVRPLLKPGGLLVLSTPNVANWSIRLMFLFGRFRYTDRGILDRTHAHLFTRKTLRQAIVAAGYHVEQLDFVTPVPGPKIPAIGALAYRIGALRPSLFAYQFVATASRPMTDGTT
jgi:O-antigen biosynthesis protein